MRLHELEVTAFGPFAGTVRVDLEQLSAHGLFLLTGDTGAGKSSILDAVCFALYGDVPGDRAVARHLRSDHADPDVEPRVVLRFSVGGRTFRITRSPAWDRPRRRGEGTRRINAHVVAEERRDDTWVALSTRLDEVGHLVGELLGMTSSQFTQVVLLPQGRFQAFLRAGSTERQEVLQRLFRTRRFADVEQWLAQRRQELTRRSREHQDACAAAVTRLGEAAGVPGPGAPDPLGAVDPGDPVDPVDPVDLETLVADGRVDDWATATRTAAEQARDEAARRLAASETAHDEARRRLDHAREQADRRARGRAAAAALADLDRTSAEEEAARTALERHRRARTVLPAARGAEAARRAVDTAGAAASRALRHLPHDRGRSADELDTACRLLGEELAVARAWLPREREVRAARRRVDELDSEVARLAQHLERTTTQAEGVRTRRTQATDEVEALTAVARQAPEDRARLVTADAGLAAARRVEALRAELAERRATLTAVTTRSQDLREHWLDLRERRVSGMAAELATGLVVGCSCPVCGSAEHPSPAAATAPVGRAEEDDAREAHEAADFERQAAQEMVTTRAAELAAAEREAGDRDLAAWAAERRDAGEASARSGAAERALPAATARLAEVDAEERRLAEQLATTRTELGERRRARDEAVDVRDRTAGELAALLATGPGEGTTEGTHGPGDPDDPDLPDLPDQAADLAEAHGPASVADLVASQEARLAALRAGMDAVTAHARAERDLALAERSLAEAVVEAGFDDPDEVRGAVLPDDRAVRLEQELRRRRDAGAAARATLADPDVAAVLETPAPDLDALSTEVDLTGLARDDAQVRHRQAGGRASRLEVLSAELDRVLAAWAPVREERALVARTAALVEGTSADNRWRMRLSAYVLSERLRQVVAAANERLVAMTDQRYVLEQADEKGAGERRGGLSLRVLDEWSGARRDPATLSGGETFVVSLALALGLADTVAHEAGGAQLDTLFIDEGFGSLDATTLDQVMDTLDTLRDGGRVVGLVSHVAELRTRVTAQLEVRKGRSGSTVHHALARG